MHRYIYIYIYEILCDLVAYTNQCSGYSRGIVFTQEVIESNVYKIHLQFEEFLKGSVSSVGDR